VTASVVFSRYSSVVGPGRFNSSPDLLRTLQVFTVFVCTFGEDLIIYVGQCMYVGHLVLWSVTSALLASTKDSGTQRRTVYESLFVEHENYRGRTREHVCLRLSPRSICSLFIFCSFDSCSDLLVNFVVVRFNVI